MIAIGERNRDQGPRGSPEVSGSAIHGWLRQPISGERRGLPGFPEDARPVASAATCGTTSRPVPDVAPLIWTTASCSRSLPEEVRAHPVGEPDDEDRSEREGKVQSRPQKCITGIRHGVLLASEIDLSPGRIMAAATARFAQDQFCRAAAKMAGEPSFQRHDGVASANDGQAIACSPDGAKRNPGFSPRGKRPGFASAPSGLRHRVVATAETRWSARRCRRSRRSPCSPAPSSRRRRPRCRRR